MTTIKELLGPHLIFNFLEAISFPKVGHASNFLQERKIEKKFKKRFSFLCDLGSLHYLG